ncbi:MerR family transcriptional regulator [Leucobacter sp. OLJS4]|uniref:TOBE domain-containing protein n=1 Tax=unclassified Leucobacter TaxID=2621730 RepID=UPI000C1A610B|nr:MULTISPECIES: TOBE domain-containing protein [unclassified Leucobacter]PIJ12505.1 MerR family transcriptional regulator [Leucobacter sp. OLES1]PII85299.1 MerR family transcriptional regulator [Leucobacter sp. OLCALW19]PII93079.1 MerR family transcriptional regulator [Leucobacter sp. OLAS13]PII95951.1 MerR family transcriptional regulator [Leucobacter sp. OLTLW20]PII99249.1 MerR family transcriptional regulator [Leucobacter sp. OLDS2]
MTHYRISDAARLIGVSDDTIRRWAADGILESGTDDAGRRTVSGASLARRALDLAPHAGDDEPVRRSARNRFTGIVTAIERSGIVAQVELQCGPNRVVSLMTSEALDDLELEIGSRATAIVKATTVIIEAERPEPRSAQRRTP